MRNLCAFVLFVLVFPGCGSESDEQIELTIEEHVDELPTQITPVGIAINQTCPRSGKPVEADSLAQYRGRTVGFCNTHCRDDFAGNINDRQKDCEFFDKIIDHAK